LLAFPARTVIRFYFNSNSDSVSDGAKRQLKTASIKVFKEDGDVSADWHFEGVIPLSYKMSNLDASSHQQPLTETVSFSCTSVKRKN
jgi:hypothetical protein